MQLLTVAELLDELRIDYPPSKQVNRTFKKAVRRKAKKHEGQHAAILAALGVSLGDFFSSFTKVVRPRTPRRGG